MKTDRQIRAETRFQFYRSPSESSAKATYYKDWPVFLIHAVSSCVPSVPCVPLCFRLSPLSLPWVPETFLARFPVSVKSLWGAFHLVKISGISGSAVNHEHVTSVRPTGKFSEKVENPKRWAGFPGRGGGVLLGFGRLC